MGAHPFRWQTGLSLESITGNRFAALEARNGHSLSSTNDKIERMARDKGLGMTGGSDSHSLRTIGKAYAVFDSGCESEDDFLEAIQKRRNAVGGGGRSAISSVGFAASCVWDWLKRGMKKI